MLNKLLPATAAYNFKKHEFILEAYQNNTWEASPKSPLTQRDLLRDDYLTAKDVNGSLSNESVRRVSRLHEKLVGAPKKIRSPWQRR